VGPSKTAGAVTSESLELLNERNASADGDPAADGFS